MEDAVIHMVMTIVTIIPIAIIILITILTSISITILHNRKQKKFYQKRSYKEITIALTLHVMN